ncbi:MAG: arsenate reductase (glutaredoxin) [Hyphomicrobiaceae bacterium]|nr:arsenate reductase (glutaredoxin) [Hyphomicrobiaceae bacterium]
MSDCPETLKPEISEPAGDDVVIYHNPACSKSRNTLALIRNAGVEPQVIEYLKTPPSRAEIRSLVARMGVPIKTILRENDKLFADLDLGRAGISDDEILDAIEAHPILINRPIVVSPLGAKVCRPPEIVLDMLPVAQCGPLATEDEAGRGQT